MTDQQRQDVVTIVSGDEAPSSRDTSSGSTLQDEQEATVRRLRFVVRAASPQGRRGILYDLNQRLARRAPEARRHAGATSTTPETSGT